MRNITGGQNLNTNVKVQKMSKRFQQKRRAKRRENLLGLFIGLHEEFEELLPSITAEISNLLSLADILWHVDWASGIIKRYIKRKEEVTEYLETIRQNEKMEMEKPGSSKIDLISLKEFKTEAKRRIKDIDTTLKNGGFEYIQKEMIKKQRQRISKSIERAVKELKTRDKAAFIHFMEALSSINSLNITYKTSKEIRWETK
jgi:hypothetical protein